MKIMDFLRSRKRAPEAALYTLRGSLLPENGIDATPFSSDVYNNSTRARKRLADVSLYALHWLLSQNAPDTTQPDDDVYNLGTCRKTESADNGVLSSGEKNFSVHRTYMNFSKPRKRAPETALYALRGSLLPENGIDATPFLSEVYKKGTRAKKRLADVSLYGRSMVEMLGVLAIIGVLSVGAISGYQKAMLKYKLNKQAVAFNMLVNNAIQNIKSFENPSTSASPVLYDTILEKLGLLPEGITVQKNGYLKDMFSNKIWLFAYPTSYGIGYAYSKGELSRHIYRNLVNIAKENASQLYRISTDQLNSETESYENQVAIYGNSYCSKAVKCLSSMTLNNLDEFCNSCTMNSCRFYIVWR